MSDQDIVRAFIAKWGEMDLDGIVGFFTEDAVYHNMPMEACVGREAIHATIEGFLGMATRIEWVAHFIADDGAGTVLTERTDKFEINGQWLALPVMGTFEIAGGKIAKWRDYFDLRDFEQQSAALQ